MRCAWLLAAGTALQLITGSADPAFLAFPWGLVCAIIFIYLLVVIHVLGGRFAWMRDLYSSHSSVSALAVLLVLLLLFGLIKQDGRTDGLWGILGFARMQRSWIFILPLVYFTAIVGLNAIEDIHHFRSHRFGTTLSHIAISMILLSGIFGSGDFVRVKMMAMMGEPTHVAMNLEKGEPMGLPFELTLEKFHLVDDDSVIKVSSDVAIRKEDGQVEELTISVNHPAKIGRWWVYQTGYDTQKGPESDYSLFTCVRDAWLGPVLIALWTFLTAGLGMIFFGIRKR